MLFRNIQIEADLMDHSFNSSEKRLARILLLLANFGKEGKMETIPKIGQEVLAARAGTTRSRINFIMNGFRKLGLIEYDGEYITTREGKFARNFLAECCVVAAPAHLINQVVPLRRSVVVLSTKAASTRVKPCDSRQIRDKSISMR